MERRAEKRAVRPSPQKQSWQLVILLSLLGVAAVLWVVRMRPTMLMAAVGSSTPPATASAIESVETFMPPAVRTLGTAQTGTPADSRPTRWSTYGHLQRDLFAWQSWMPEPVGPVVLGPDAQAHHRRIREAAAHLRVQALMVGQTPRVVIDGQSYRPGEQVAGFQVQQILRDRVRLEREGVIVELP